MVTESSSAVVGGDEAVQQVRVRKFGGVIDMFIILIVMIVSWL